MGVIIGSARIGENGSITGGAAGDQKQTSTPDYKGEVSLENFYVHRKGWYVIRAKSDDIANKIASAMIRACNNPNIGYDQNGRYGVVTNGTNTKVKTEADCSSLVRTCVKEASGKDPGDFNTSSEPGVLQKTGLFEATKTYTSGMTLYTGDILVTKTKGHTVIVTNGAKRGKSQPTIKETKVNYTGKVNATSLNIRKGPDTSYAIQGSLKKDASVTIIAEANNWGKLSTGGWVSLQYIKKNTSSFKKYDIKIIADVLNIREKPGTDNKIVGTTKKNDKHTITKEKDGWGKISTGWISLKYTKKI